MNSTLRKTNTKTELYNLIEYLTLYVNVQEAQIDRIIINASDTEYILFNSHHREICRMKIKDNNLLDVLVTLAPKQIEISSVTKFKDKELMKIIVAIFKERVNMYMN